MDYSTQREPLLYAAAEIDANLRADEDYPELVDYLTPGASGDYSSTSDAPFIRKANVPLPPILVDQFSLLRVKSFMGIFPELSRAWITVDNRLFLWRFDDLTGTDIIDYSGLDQIIISAAVVKPKEDVFNDDVKYLLVLATPVEIVILAVIFENNEAKLYPSALETQRFDFYFGQFTPARVRSAKFALPSDNVNMLKIVGTSTGRIFLGGNDGSLNEVQYQAEDGWFTRKCRKLNYSASRIMSYVPTLFKWGSDPPIVDMVVDDTRHILYALSDNGAIQVVDLGTDGQGFTKVISRSDIENDAIKYCPQQLHGNDRLTLQVVSVHAVPATESGAIHLVAVTRGGHRLYFTTSERHRGRRLAYDRSQRPVGLELLHVRFPPQNAGPSNPTFPQKAGYLLNDVRVAFYGHGVFVAAEPSPERQHQDMLVGIGNDNAKLLPRTSYSSRAGFYESFNNAELDGKAWALAEIPLSTFAKVPAALIDNMSLRSELATQHLIPPRQFACLTSAGMIIFEKLRPVDRLQDILIRTRGAESAEMKAFFQNYNADQACAMCLTLACGSSSKASFGARDVDLAQFATHAFFNYGGRPYYEVPASFAPSGGWQSPGNQQQMLRARTLVPSNSLRGFATYLARILRSVWNSPVIASRSGGAMRAKFPADQLELIQNQLLSLRDFLVNNPGFSGVRSDRNPGPSGNLARRMLEMQHRRADDEAKKEEQNVLFQLVQLLQRALEVLAFLRILVEHDVKSILKDMSSSFKTRAVQMKFCDIVKQSEAEVLRDIINRLTDSVKGDAGQLDRLTERLRNSSPSLFSDSDRIKLKAINLLEYSWTLPSIEEKHNVLQQALQLLLQIPQYVAQTGLLPSICNWFQWMRFYEGIVALCLKCADAIDPQNYGLAHVRDGGKGDEKAKAAYDARVAIYQQIAAVLDELHHGPEFALPAPDGLSGPRPELPTDDMEAKISVLKMARKSTDELFHYYLYGWYLQNNLQTELILLQTPFLETFMQKYMEPPIERLQLLWQYYTRHGNDAAGSRTALQLALFKGANLKLSDRTKYLTDAYHMAMGRQNNNQELTRDIQDRLEVAKVQRRIYNDIDRLSDQHQRERLRQQLDEELYDATQLYKFASALGCHEAALALFHISGYSDSRMIRSLWEGIFDEYEHATKSAYKIAPLKTKVTDLTIEFHQSELVFPLGFIVETLEKISRQFADDPRVQDWNPTWVVDALLAGGVAHHGLFSIYKGLIDGNADEWRRMDGQLHIFFIVHYLIDSWAHRVENATAMDADRRAFRLAKLETALDEIITKIPALPEQSARVHALVDDFRTLRTRLVSTRY